jgi:hypothetical protein
MNDYHDVIARYRLSKNEIIANDARRIPIFERKITRFYNAVTSLQEAQIQGTIANADFKAWKEDLVDVIGDAWNWKWCEYQTLNRDQAELYLNIKGSFQFNHVQGKIRKLQASKIQAPFIKPMLSFLREIESLADLIEEMKDKVVKRQVKPVEDRKEGYYPPHASTETQKLVIQLLEEVTQTEYEHLRIWFIDVAQNKLLAFEHASADAIQANKTLTPESFFFTRERGLSPDYTSYNIVFHLIEEDKSTINTPFHTGIHSYHRKPNWQILLQKHATQQADSIRMGFVHKNFSKIASILDAKGDYASAEVCSSSINLGSLEGSLLFKFRDGSHFTVRNAMVMVYNHPTAMHPFARHPLTFHDVVMQGGQPIKKVSEQWMNEEFVREKTIESSDPNDNLPVTPGNF